MAIDSLLSGLKNSGVTSGLAGGMAGGLLAGALASKKGRKHLGTAVKVGGVAALGGLAYKAYQNYKETNQQGQAPAAPGQGNPAANPQQWAALEQKNFDVDPNNSAEGSRSLLLIRAMITAAHSDGHLDTQEQGRIFTKISESELTPADKANILDEFKEPLSMQDIVAMSDSPETAVEIYLASLLAIDETKTEGKNYLNALGFMLNIPPALVAQLHEQAHPTSSTEGFVATA